MTDPAPVAGIVRYFVALPDGEEARHPATVTFTAQKKIGQLTWAHDKEPPAYQTSLEIACEVLNPTP